MGWQNLLKNDSSKEIEGLIPIFTEELEKKYIGWDIRELSISTIIRNDIYLQVRKTESGNPTISCRIKEGAKPISAFLLLSLEEQIEEILKTMEPTFRSLNWLYEVTTPISEIEFGINGIYVQGNSGNNYLISTDELKSSGCYGVETDEKYSICIEMESEKPAGDNLLALTLGLLNDDESRNEIEGLEEYIDNRGSASCPVCEAENEFNITQEEFSCDNCGSTINLKNISFEPGLTYSAEAEEAEGPLGWFNPELAHVQGDIFVQGNKIFRIGSPDDYDLTVARNFDEILEYSGYGEIYVYANEPYNENGYEMDLGDVRGQFSNDSDFIRFTVNTLEEEIDEIYAYLEYENLGGNLWNDGLGGYLDGDGNFTDDIEEIYNLSELSEEDFIMNAIEEWGMDEEEVLNLFDYEEDGKYWTKDGKKYELVGGEMVEQDEGEITKNLSSKAVLPINMKWTDYLRKTSNTKAEDWESALKSFISDGKKLGIPLSVMELLKLAKEATTSQSEGFETLHRPTFSEEEEEDV